MNPHHELIFRRALQSHNPKAVFNVAHEFHRLGDTKKANTLFQRMAIFHGMSYGFGVDYAAVQQKLNTLGASPALVVDGKWGPKSKTALIAFQKSKGLSADGVPGPITLGALGITDSSTVTSSPTQTTSQASSLALPTSIGLASLKWPLIGAGISLLLMKLL